MALIGLPCQPTAAGERQGNDRDGTRVAQRDCSRLPVFLPIELHPRVPAGHRHDAGRVPTKFAIAPRPRAVATTIMTLRTGAGLLMRGRLRGERKIGPFRAKETKPVSDH
jgi:hypothetical protein